MHAYIPVALLGVLLAACGQTGSTVTAAPNDGDPQGDWQLVEGTLNGQTVLILDEHRITLTIEGSRIGGTAACNGYGGTLNVEGGRLRIEDLAQTLMACVDEEAMQAESTYMAGLRAADSIALDGELLVITGPGLELQFVELAPPPTAEMVDTVWLLETLVSDGVAASVAGEPSTLELRSDGSISFTTGCRRFDGTWLEQGDEIMTPSLGSDDVACPVGLQDAENLVLSVIGDGFRATVDGDQLTLTDSGGLGLVYRASE